MPRQNGERGRTRTSLRRASRQGAVASARDLFVYEFHDVYTAERLLLVALEDMAGDSTDTGLAQAFRTHREETEGHLERLDEVAASLGIEVSDGRSPIIEGLLEEKALFAKAQPTPEVLNLFNAAAGQKGERYEISQYESLIELGGKLGYTSAILKLRENLAEEQAALKALKALSDRLRMHHPEPIQS